MKKWISIAVIVVMSAVTRGAFLLPVMVVFMGAAGLDVLYGIHRDRRYRYTPFALTRRLWRLVFVTPPSPSPPMQMPPPSYYIPAPNAYVPPDAPVGERNSRVIPQDVKIAVANRDDGRCRQCGSQEELHYDHIIPWSKGGANTVGNVQLLCGGCNRRKSASMPWGG